MAPVRAAEPESEEPAPEGEVSASEPTLGDELARRFAGSQLFVQTSANLNTFVPDLQQTRNATVDMSWTFLPRFDLGEGFQLRGRIGFNYEFTDSDITVRANELVLSDTTLQLFYRNIPALPWGTKVQSAVFFGFPTSKASQSQTNLLTPGVLVQAFQGFEALGGSLMLMGTASYARPLYERTTPGTTEPLPYDVQCFDVADLTCTGQSSGVANVRDNVTWSLIAIGFWGPVAPALFFRMSHQVPYSFEDREGVDDDPVDGNGVRAFSTFAVWVDYDISSWLTAELGYIMTRNVLSAEGRFGNPLFDRYEDMRLYLAVNIGLDRFYKALAGVEGGAAGVIRN